jgi:DNA-binding YbaB/EbfC family protein
MFEKIGQIASLLRNLPRLREEMERLQASLAQLSADGDAGAGMVKVRVNGRQEVLSVALSAEALGLGDREMLEDLIRAATNQALERVRKLIAEETSRMAVNLGLPLGMGLPGLGLPGLG